MVQKNIRRRPRSHAGIGRRMADAAMARGAGFSMKARVQRTETRTLPAVLHRLRVTRLARR